MKQFLEKMISWINQLFHNFPFSWIIGIKSPCSVCNDRISKEPARIIIFNKNQICEEHKLLNPPLPILNQEGAIAYSVGNVNPEVENLTIPIATREISNNCGQPVHNELTLAGYYIMPESELNEPNNRIKFIPIWIYHNQNSTVQLVGQEIILGPEKWSKLDYMSNLNSDDNYQIGTYISTEVINGTFNHNVLQFHPIIVKFNRAYISWYELKMILENCDYFGIAGARISTGNIAPKSWSSQNNPAALNYTGNINYFTYRIIGFNTTTIPDILVKSGAPKNGENFNPSIPTETWATPCPPMWKPQ